VDSASQGAITGYTFYTITANHTISASFAIDTYVRSEGGGGSPIVKCKWEQEPVTVPETADPQHSTDGSQFMPPLAKCVEKPIDYYAVVTDKEDGGNVYEVFAYVYHPADSPSPYSDLSDPEGL
jgi:hypothetical protein